MGSLEMALRTAVLPALMLAVLTATLVRVESSPLVSDRAAVKTHAQKAESRLFWITLLLAKRRCFEPCHAVAFSPDTSCTLIFSTLPCNVLFPFQPSPDDGDDDGDDGGDDDGDDGGDDGGD